MKPSEAKSGDHRHSRARLLSIFTCHHKNDNTSLLQVSWKQGNISVCMMRKRREKYDSFPTSESKFCVFIRIYLFKQSGPSFVYHGTWTLCRKAFCIYGHLVSALTSIIKILARVRAAIN